MSKTQDKDETMVYVTRKANSDKRWHSTDDPKECYNAPENAHSMELWKIEGHYQPCAICTDRNPDRKHNNNGTEFECSGCGQMEWLAATGVRTLHACHECGDVMNWERVEDVRQ